MVGTNECKVANENSSIPKSTLHSDANVQGLIDSYAGTTGKSVNNIPLGAPGSVERISHNQSIGIFIDGQGNNLGMTNSFTIKYAKDGVHIVPARP